jgi:hypothetical protein
MRIKQGIKKTVGMLRLFPEWTRISGLMALDRAARRIVVIVDVEEVQFLPFVLPVVVELKKRPQIRVYIATRSIYKNRTEFSKSGVPPARRFDIALSRRMNNAAIFLSAHIHAQGPEKAVRIHMFHNQPVKYVAFPAGLFKQYGIHFVLGILSRESTENMITQHGLQDRNIRLFDVGYPKLDELVQGRFSKKEVLRSLGLNPDLPTALYAPSWDEGLSLRTEGERIIETLLNIPGLNVLVKLHPCSLTSPEHPNFIFYTGGIQWEKVIKRFDGHPRFRFLTDAVINPLLAASDLMVTDVSSVALEYLVLDRPIIYFDSPAFFEKTISAVYSEFGYAGYKGDPRKDPMLNAGRHTGIVIGGAVELPEAVQRCLANPQELSTRRQDLISQLLYNPGSAARAAAETIERLAQL